MRCFIYKISEIKLVEEVYISSEYSSQTGLSLMALEANTDIKITRSYFDINKLEMNEK
jgi:hypothetical protein